MNFALAFCPQFAGRGMPLGIGYINAVLRNAGHNVTPLDFETQLVAEDAGLYRSLYDMINIGGENEAVHFVLRLDLVVWALYEDDLGRFPRSIPDSERVTVAALRERAKLCARQILSVDPDVALFSTYIGSLFFSLLVAQQLKATRAELPVVFGGPGCSNLEVASFLLRTHFVDACVMGEGEVSVHEVAEALSRRADLAGIAGVAVLRNGQVVYAERPLMDLADLPIPDFSGFPFPGANLRTYLIKYPRMFIPISSSRGCTLKCAFCTESSFWRRFRHRSPEAVVAEMVLQSQRWGSDIFYFCDSLLNSTEEWLQELCERMIAAPVEVRVDFAYLQARFLSQSTLESMARAGFRRVNYGVESASQHILTRMGKATNVDEIARIIRDTVGVGIQVDFPLLAHMPGESRDDVWTNLAFLHELERSIPTEQLALLNYSTVTRFRVEAYSRVFQRPQAFGIAITPYEFHIPGKADHLRDSLENLLLRWRSEIDPEERQLRYELYRRHRSTPEVPRGYTTKLVAGDRLRLGESVEFVKICDGNEHPYRLSDGVAAASLSRLGKQIVDRVVAGDTIGEIATGLDKGETVFAFLQSLVDAELLVWSAASPSMAGETQITAERHAGSGRRRLRVLA